MRTDRKDLFKHRFQKHYPRLCSIAYGYVLDRDESEDIVQEVFIHIWDKGKDDLPEQEFLAYLTTAVKNNCISFLRKRKDSPASLEDYPLADSHPAEEDHHGEESHRSAEEIVEDALGTLPPKCKDIFVMAKLKGMKYREIAQTLNLSDLKDGNKQEHVRTLSLDMPSTSLTLEGPLIKDKLSYIVSGRRSWLDFFDNLLSEENRLNHSSYDYNAKLTYNLSPSSSLKLMAYHAQDNYHLPDDEGDQLTILKWNNQIYQATYNVSSGKLGNTTSVFYTTHSNRADAEALGFDSEGYIQSGIKSLNVSTEFTYNPENIYSARWGSKYMYETYNLATFGNTIRSRKEPIHQFSIFYDNLIRLHQRLNIQVGVHFIGYLPQNYRSYYSIQPRFSLKYQPDDKDLFYVHFSRMEQFYHYIRFSNLSLPTDFRMPSIEGYKPRSSEHYELGWKHILSRGQVEISGYYKTRRNVVALRPEAFIEDDQ